MEPVRNPNNMKGDFLNGCDASIMHKYVKIVEQRERILESFLAEHSGTLPSNIRQVITPLENGDVAWHVEAIT